MKPSRLLPLAAAAGALPADAPRPQVSMRHGVPSTLDSAISHLGRAALNAADAVVQTGRRVPEYHDGSGAAAAVEAVTGALQLAQDVPTTRGQRERTGPSANRSVFEIIRQSGQATYFAQLLESHARLRDMCDGDDDEEAGVFTVLAPTDAAFRELKGFERSEGALLGAMLEYHVLEGRRSADELGKASGTLPTVLAEGELGGRQQRVRVAAGRAGAEVNFYGRVVGSESNGRNGVVHFIDSVLVPPPRCAALVGSLAGRLGTFSRALRETRVAEEMRGRGRGVTLFAPSDEAWEEKLGAEARGFLLSRAGRAYLRALVRYHVAEEVLYTDDGEERRRRRVGTLLGGEDVSVDFGGRDGSRTARVNGAAVSVGDVPARDGVVHVLDGVLLPPIRGTADGDEAADEGRISVQGLKRRLGRYVEGGDGAGSEEL